MKFTLESGSSSNLVRGYSAREVRIGEHVLTASCLVARDALIADWRPQRIEELEPADLEPLFALAPEVVLIGTGSSQRLVPAALRESFAQRGIGIESMDLGAACRTFNVLVQEERRVVAALFLAG